MILSDVTILDRLNYQHSDPRRIGIDPFDRDALQGASVDLRLGATILHKSRTITLVEGQIFILPPGGVCLAATYERIVTPCDCVARLEGKSSIGRQFVIVHCCAGWCDPGFTGVVTIEIVNHDPEHAFAMSLHMRIAQLTFLQLDQPAERQYKGRYQGDMTVSAAKPWPL